MRTSLLTVTALFGAMAAPLLAEEVRPSRHVYRGNDSGTAERLAQPRSVTEPIRVVKTQPLGERGTSTGTVAASNLSSRSQVIASGFTYGVDVRQPTPAVQYVNVPPPANQDRTQVDNNARILAASASPDYRLAVDRNARVVRNYAIYQEQQQGQPQPQSDAQPQFQEQQPDAQPQAGFVSAPPPQPNQQIVYGNTYGTYSQQGYESNLKYTQPVTYTVERNYYYPVSYAPAYCAPSYSYVGYYSYRPSYSYCAPTYYSCYTPRYSIYCGPRYGGYVSYNSGYCGPRYYGGGYGGYVGYRSGGYCGSRYGGYVGYSSGGRCGSSWSFGFRF